MGKEAVLRGGDGGGGGRGLWRSGAGPLARPPSSAAPCYGRGPRAVPAAFDRPRGPRHGHPRRVEPGGRARLPAPLPTGSGPGRPPAAGGAGAGWAAPAGGCPPAGERRGESGRRNKRRGAGREPGAPHLPELQSFLACPGVAGKEDAAQERAPPGAAGTPVRSVPPGDPRSAANAQFRAQGWRNRAMRWVAYLYAIPPGSQPRGNYPSAPKLWTVLVYCFPVIFS